VSSPQKALVIVFSYHHKNTEKIAQVIAQVLGTSIKTPQQINIDELNEYHLIGFGSGIYGEKHHKTLLDLADTLPSVTNKNTFIFSTHGAPAIAGEVMVETNHSVLRDKLQAKGYVIVDEFSCRGFNTNSFLRLFGGINKGRPNTEDLQQAKAFATQLKQNFLNK
jgi:flavodoxin